MMNRDTFEANLNNLTCRRILEENHGNTILRLLEEQYIDEKCRYVASISPKQVNIYDCEDKNTRLGFFAHFVVEASPYFKGGNCTCGEWLYRVPSTIHDSVIAVGTDKGEIFLLSCQDCRIATILTNPNPVPIMTIASSSAYPNLLLSLDLDGHVILWNWEARTIVKTLTDVSARYLCWNQEFPLIYLMTGDLVYCNMQDYSLTSLPVLNSITRGSLLNMIGLPRSRQWLLVFSSHLVLISSEDPSQTRSITIPATKEYFSPEHMSITRDEKHLLISDNVKARIISLDDGHEGILVDNYSAGNTNQKDQTAYKRAAILNVILHPQARHAVMAENNRILRFDAIDPNTKYVAQVKFPHPVDDMYLFYNSLNADPLMYLNPKISSPDSKK